MIPKIRFERRLFLKHTVGLAVAAFGWPGLLNSSEQEAIKKPIPKTGEKLPVIGMGTSRTFDIAGDSALRQKLTDVLQVFFDRGGAVIDSSSASCRWVTGARTP